NATINARHDVRSDVTRNVVNRGSQITLSEVINAQSQVKSARPEVHTHLSSKGQAGVGFVDVLNARSRASADREVNWQTNAKSRTNLCPSASILIVILGIE